MVEFQDSPNISINRIMDIYKRLNDIYYKEETGDSNIVHVLRDIKNIDCKPFDYSTLKLKDFFNPNNNKKFANICPALTRRFNNIGIYVQMHNRITEERQDFLIIRKSLGDILASIAEITAGQNLTDRAENEYVFGEPINIKGFRKQFMKELMTKKENDELLQFIKIKAEGLQKYCSYKTRGMSSVIRAVDRITDANMAEWKITQKEKNGKKK